MKPYRLVSRENKTEDTIVSVQSGMGKVSIGRGTFVIIAGPCAVESWENYLRIAGLLKEMGAHILRGGVFKPRTSPYSFQGLGDEGLTILLEAKRQTGLPVVTEVLDVRELEKVAEVADIIQIGSRNMQNYSLLKEVGRMGKPVLLKRGFACTLEEWLLAAEYILVEGNEEVIMCERGIRTFESWMRNTVDIAAVPFMKELSHLPVIVDPSHGTGRWQLVRPMAKAALAAGADGVMVEVHLNPDQALSDGGQSLSPPQFALLVEDLKKIAAVEGKEPALLWP